MRLLAVGWHGHVVASHMTGHSHLSWPRALIKSWWRQACLSPHHWWCYSPPALCPPPSALDLWSSGGCLAFLSSPLSCVAWQHLVLVNTTHYQLVIITALLPIAFCVHSHWSSYWTRILRAFETAFLLVLIKQELHFREWNRQAFCCYEMINWQLFTCLLEILEQHWLGLSSCNTLQHAVLVLADAAWVSGLESHGSGQWEKKQGEGRGGWWRRRGGGVWARGQLSRGYIPRLVHPCQAANPRSPRTPGHPGGEGRKGRWRHPWGTWCARWVI